MSKARRTQLWFSQEGIRGILGGTGELGEGEEEERGEVEEVERTVKAFKEKGGQLWERTEERKREIETKRGECNFVLRS